MHYEYVGGSLHLEKVDLAGVAAALGTPCFVYSRDAIESRFDEYVTGFGGRRHKVCYSVKANGNLSIISLLSKLGSGFDIVSGGELERVLAADGSARNVVFSGVGKSRNEIDAAIGAEIGCINVESRAELERIAAAAEAHNKVVAIAIRVNPDVDPDTHPYVATGLKESKFGVPIDQVYDLYRVSADNKWLNPIGIACHIGSQLISADPVVDALTQVVEIAEKLRATNIDLQRIDVGGGLGIHYKDECPPTIKSFIESICTHVPERYEIVVEPGRSLVGESGLLLTRVEYLKTTTEKIFVIVDAGMNDLIRPALYNVWHNVLVINERNTTADAVVCDVVGPVCETGDWFARDRELRVAGGDLLALTEVGAYGFAMSSNYNSRPRPPEVLVEGERFTVIRPRESTMEMLAKERDCMIC